MTKPLSKKSFSCTFRHHLHSTSPPIDWAKPTRGCGSSGLCKQLDRFLRDPSKGRESFILQHRQKHLVESHIRNSSRPNEDDLEMILDHKVTALTKTNSKWMGADNAWRERSSEIANKIGQLMPEMSLLIMLGEDVFELWQHLRRTGSMATLPLPLTQTSFPATSTRLSNHTYSASQPLTHSKALLRQVT